MSFNLSLNSSVRSCKVDDGWSNRIASDRFLNPNNAQCIRWNGFDTAGRPAHQNTFYTKRGGCNSPLDRMLVENYLRPDYVSYINLNAGGIEGAFYGGNNDSDVSRSESKRSRESDEMAEINSITGNYGINMKRHVTGHCGVDVYQNAINNPGYTNFSGHAAEGADLGPAGLPPVQANLGQTCPRSNDLLGSTSLDAVLIHRPPGPGLTAANMADRSTKMRQNQVNEQSMQTRKYKTIAGL